MTEGADAGRVDPAPPQGQREAFAAFDWSATPLGPRAGWPAGLATFVEVMLAAQQPMFLAWGPEQVWLYNDATTAILGRKHPAALGRPSREVWAEAWDVLAPLFDRVFAGEALHFDDARLPLDRSGRLEEAAFIVSYTPVQGADGRIEGLFGVCLETTRQVQATQSLRGERERFEQLFARQAALLSLSDAIRDLEDPTEIAYAASGVLAKALGVSRVGYGIIDKLAETITIERDWNAPGIRSLAGVLNFRDYGSYIENLKRGETVAIADAELDPRTRDTAHALKAISAQAFVNMPLVEQGQFVALLYANHADRRPWAESDLTLMRELAERVRDATERARSELALRESEDQFRAFAQAVPNQIWASRPDGYLYWFNDQAYAYVGVEEGALDGPTGWSEVVHPDDLIEAGGAWLASLATGEVYETEFRIRRADGAYRWFLVRAEPVRGADGAIVRWVGSNIDIDDRRRQAVELALMAETLEQQVAERTAALMATEEALRQSQKMEAVGQLTGGIAHDFNNLLQGITGSLDLVQKRITQGRIGEIDRFVSGAMASANRAAALTHRLLAFSRRQPLDPRPIRANPLVASMEDMLRRTLGERIELELVLAGGLWLTQCDPNQLESAILNLAINARDAMPDGGKLTIETCNAHLDTGYVATQREVEPGQYVCICVTDTGTGMDPDTAAKAFEPFFTTKPIGQGTGLGLSMIYGFTRQSEGYAKIYSELGNGTTVKLYLPRHRGTAEADEARPELTAAHVAAPGETVLVVEDEPVVRGLIVEVLSDLGYQAIEAADGPAGLDILQSKRRIDLLVTDIGLPGLNGRQIAEAGRQLRPDLKILYMTGYAENAALASGFLEPGMSMITKPFAMEALATRIRDIIEDR